MIKKLSRAKLAAAASLLAFAGLSATQASAASFSFVGNLASDDEIQLFNFTISGSSNVILKTLSYAGGTNAQGQAIAAGGFDPILAVFDAAGVKINFNDDGLSSQVPSDPVTGEFYDTYLELGSLAAGTYTVAVTQYDNFAPASLAAMFSRQSTGNFTSSFGCSQQFFCDIGGANRDSHWAFDILNVDVASNPTGGGDGNPDVPLPAAFWLFGSAVAGLAGAKRLRKSSN